MRELGPVPGRTAVAADLPADGRRGPAQAPGDLGIGEPFDLADVARKPAAAYSGGLRRRLDLAMTMVGGPRLIFLDEPTAGLDPRSRRDLWRTVKDLVANDGVTVLLTTQYLEDADQLADRVALLSRGTLVAEGTPEELKHLIPGGHITVSFADQDALTVQISEAGVVRTLRTLLDRLDAQGADVAGLMVHTPDLDDVFLTLTDTDTTATFVYVLGGTLSAGLGGNRAAYLAYLAYLTPGILATTIAGAAQGTAIAVAMDMS
ncbi:hypothetical protein ABIA35_008000 [Catenulispora sp. MAP12-49]